MLPEATGLSSNSTKMSLSLLPNAPSIVWTVCENLWAGALACNFVSSMQRSLGNKSGRVAAHWPHLINAAPANSNVWWTRCSHVCRKRP
ncbi:hypothetical protein GOP47_0016885 [Adiantum capillus-veneris]|uniref:Uncharacterized protein n=1 Tax=Adiantum capillus-veneris TaxID=13818 RepID=A0A9D4UIK5_ADICA|nr:hypothetical protein GOP47_0016885 [Adiantum capillus-veneris]